MCPGVLKIPLSVFLCVSVTYRGTVQRVLLLEWLIRAELTTGVLTVVLPASPSSVCLPSSPPSPTAAPCHLLYNQCPPPSLPLLSPLPSFDPFRGPLSAFRILPPANFRPSFLFLFPRIALTSPVIYLPRLSFTGSPGRSLIPAPPPAHSCAIRKNSGGGRKNETENREREGREGVVWLWLSY